MEPAVSVLMPVYNGARYLRASIESVLAQTFREFELLISDDGSSDDSREIAASFADPRIRILGGPPPGGLFRNHNALLAEARGRYIKYQHQDDRMLPFALERFVRLADAHPRAAYVAAATHILLASDDVPGTFPWCLGQSREWAPGTLSTLSRRLGNIIGNPPSVLLRRAVLDNAAFDESMKNAADWRLLLDLADRHPVCSTGEVLVQFRDHAQSQSTAHHGDLTTAFEDLAILAEHARAAGDAATPGLWRAAGQVLARAVRALRGGGDREYWAAVLTRLLKHEEVLERIDQGRVMKDIRLLRVMAGNPDATTAAVAFTSVFMRALWGLDTVLAYDWITYLRTERDPYHRPRVVLVGWPGDAIVFWSVCGAFDARVASIYDPRGTFAGQTAYGARISAALELEGADGIAVMLDNRMDDFRAWLTLSEHPAAGASGLSVMRVREWTL